MSARRRHWVQHICVGLSLCWVIGELNADTLRSTKTKPVVLSPVVVTATGQERQIGESLSSVSVVEGERLRNQPVLDLADAVRSEPGVQVMQMGLGRRGISIRGMRPDHTLYLVDGRRLSPSSSISHSDFELDWVPAEAIERVEVLRGPISSLYGSEAMGGVVNVITRDATDSWLGAMSATSLLHGQGAGNLYKTGLYVGGPIQQDRIGLQVWGELKRRNALADTLFAGINSWEKVQSQQGAVRLHIKPTTHQVIELSSMFGYENRHDQRGILPHLYGTKDKTHRFHHALRYQNQAEVGELNLHLYQVGLRRTNHRTDGHHAEPVRFTDSVLDVQYRLDSFSDQVITVGGEYRKEQLREASVNQRGHAKANHWALLIQDEVQLGPDTEMVVGVRGDHHQEFGWELSPRIYAIHQLSEAWRIKGGVGSGFKAPNLKQLSPEFESFRAMGGRGVVRGNPGLQPEKNMSYEVGVQYQMEPWDVGLTIFHNEVKQLIVTQRQAACDVRGRVCLNYENVERARFQGVELTNTWQLSKAISVAMNYTYLRAKDSNTGRDLDDRARHVFNTRLHWSPSERWQLRLLWEHIGSMPYTQNTQTYHQPSYDLWSMYADYQMSKQLQLLFGIENLMDKKLANDGTGRYSTRSEAGRGVFIGLRAGF